MVTLCFFGGTAKLFSKMVVPFYIFPSSGKMFQFLNILANHYYYFLYCTVLNECEVLSNCGFDLHFSRDYYIVSSFVLIVAVVVESVVLEFITLLSDAWVEKRRNLIFSYLIVYKALSHLLSLLIPINTLCNRARIIIFIL